jgi:hypothetical protein
LGKTIALRFENVKLKKNSALPFENVKFQTNFAQTCRVGSDMDISLDEYGPLAKNSAAKLTRSELNTTG